MAILFDIIWLLLFVVLLPYLVAVVLLGKLLVTVMDIFYVRVLWGAIGVATLAVITWSKRVPNDALPFQSVTEVLAQSQVAGIQMPYLLAVLAAVLFLVSVSKAFRKREAGSL